MIPRPTRKDLIILIVVLAATACVILYGLHWRFAEQFEPAQIDAAPPELSASSAQVGKGPEAPSQSAAPRPHQSRVRLEAPAVAAARRRVTRAMLPTEEAPETRELSAAMRRGDMRCIDGLVYTVHRTEAGTEIKQTGNRCWIESP